ncbi:MAG: NYN domain-containing protein [Clostridia bacterium]|nr:NYN domain-containing protein [Clostridia bacterium]
MAANIAIFIDAENVDPSFANQIFSYARSLGEVTVREIYGSGIALNEWADAILENTIHTNFTLRPNKYKNSSDIALTIGAMELLSTSRIATDSEKPAAVVIASSDSDFSPLAFHLRAAGIDVIGMGEPGRINPMWPKACTEFVELKLGQPLVRRRETPPASQPIEQKPAVPVAEETPSAQTVENVALAAEPSEPAKPAPEKTNEAVKIAPSHPARVGIIRSFITEQLAAYGGRMKSGELFKLLSTVPDYNFDQQRSRRKPLDYLEKQYGEWFVLSPGENGSYWISARPVSSPAVDSRMDEQPAAEKDAETLPDDPRVALIEAGIPVQDAGRVAEILSDSKTLFSAYNELSKAFGRKQGGQYYQMIKERFAVAPSSIQPEITQIAPAEEETAVQPAVEEQMRKEAPEQESTSLERFLADHGVEAAAQIASIIAGTPNLRVAYNELRKVFGAADGRAYFSLVKKYKV